MQTKTTLDLTDDEAEYLLSLLRSVAPSRTTDPLAPRTQLWTSTRNKVAARLGKR